jgi:hypothetical protein
MNAFLLFAAPAQAADTLAPIVVKADNSKTDWQDDLQRIFDKAAQNAQRVELPAGTFLHSGVLVIRGIEVSGMGTATVLEGTTPNNAAIILTGSGSKLSSMKLTFKATKRSGFDEASLLLVKEAQNFKVSNLLLDGSDCAGIFVLSASYGVIEGNEVNNTLSDSIHITGASHDIVVKDNTTHYSGDDGIAVVSYEKYPRKSEHISILHNTVLDNKYARGISAVGGNDIDITDNFVRCTQGYAGIYIASEPSFQTFGATNIKVRRNTVTGCGGPKIGHGAIMVYTEYRDNEHILISDNTLLDSPGIGIRILGKGNLDITVKDNTIQHPVGPAISQEQLLEPIHASGNIIK